MGVFLRGPCEHCGRMAALTEEVVPGLSPPPTILYLCSNCCGRPVETWGRHRYEEGLVCGILGTLVAVCAIIFLVCAGLGLAGR